MGEETGISWTDHTFNPWWGCDEVSPACANCYAKAWAARFGLGWGADAPRRFFGDKHWDEPRKWNRKAVADGIRRFVFCASMADVFEDNGFCDPITDQTMSVERLRLFRLIEETPNLIWLLLTKRPENMRVMTVMMWPKRWPPNVIAMATVEDQKRADLRLPELAKVPAQWFGLSMEPLFGFVQLPEDFLQLQGRAWIITGGESGENARPGHPDWYRSLREQATANRIPFHFKQWGEWRPSQDGDIYDTSLGRAAKPFPAFLLDYTGRVHCFHETAGDGAIPIIRVGKKTAGRLLDGRTWDEFPEVRH